MGFCRVRRVWREIQKIPLLRGASLYHPLRSSGDGDLCNMPKENLLQLSSRVHKRDNTGGFSDSFFLLRWVNVRQTKGNWIRNLLLMPDPSSYLLLVNNIQEKRSSWVVACFFFLLPLVLPLVSSGEDVTRFNKLFKSISKQLVAALLVSRDN